MESTPYGTEHMTTISSLGPLNIRCFPGRRRSVIFDTNTCRVFTVNTGGSDILSALRESDPEAACAALLDRYRKSDIDEFIGILGWWKERGILSTSPPDRPESDADPPLSFLRLHIADPCNMNCTYCYSGTGPSGRGSGLMGMETAERAVDFLVEKSGSERVLSLDFYGGEPLLNFPVIEHCVAFARARGQDQGKEFKFSIFTNGTLLTDDIIRFLHENRFEVAISVDGPAPVQDEQRPMADGQGSHGIVHDRIMHLLESLPPKKTIGRATMTCRNHDIVSMVAHLADLGFRNISVQECNLPANHPYAIHDDEIPRILADFDRFVDLWRGTIAASAGPGKLWRPVVFLPVTNLFSRLHDGPPALDHCHAGERLLAVTSSGDLYPCHEFVGIPDHRLGSVFGPDRGFQTKRNEFLRSVRMEDKPRCRVCWAKHLCGGGCPAHALKYSRDIREPYAIGCDIMKHRSLLAILFYEWICRTYPDLLDELMYPWRHGGWGDPEDMVSDPRR